MIGLDFVKSVDKGWRKHITFADGSPYYDDFCPLSNARCRREDCLFWGKKSKGCIYIKGGKRKDGPKSNNTKRKR